MGVGLSNAKWTETDNPSEHAQSASYSKMTVLDIMSANVTVCLYFLFRIICIQMGGGYLKPVWLVLFLAPGDIFQEWVDCQKLNMSVNLR